MLFAEQSSPLAKLVAVILLWCPSYVCSLAKKVMYTSALELPGHVRSARRRDTFNGKLSDTGSRRSALLGPWLLLPLAFSPVRLLATTVHVFYYSLALYILRLGRRDYSSRKFRTLLGSTDWPRLSYFLLIEGIKVQPRGLCLCISSRRLSLSLA